MTSHALAARTMRGRAAEQMLRRRDAAGPEAEMLARVMQDPNPNPEVVTGYIRQLLQKGHIPPEEARRLLATVPHDPEALRNWAQVVFQTVMHQGIHAHAAFPRSVFPSPATQGSLQAQEQPQQAAPQAAPPAPDSPALQNAPAPLPPPQGPQQ